MLSDLVTHEGSETSVQFQQKLAVSDIIKLLKTNLRTLPPEVVTLLALLLVYSGYIMHRQAKLLIIAQT